MSEYSDTPAGGDSGKPENQGDDPPLRGIRVLDLTQNVAGPFCTSMLADLGAEVVKLERLILGDSTRNVVKLEGREEHQDCFNANNRNKKSIDLDLKDPAHRSIGLELARQCDILVENFAPGTADRLGMGWKDLHALNPRLVYCSISGFGQTGPYRDQMAVDPIIQAVSGVMSVTGQPDGEPMMIGSPLADVISGMCASSAILGSLRAAERDGKGQYIDVAMQASMIAALSPRLGEAIQTGRSTHRMGNQNPIRVPADAYPTKDGRYLMVSVSFDHNWAPFCRAIECEDWIVDTRFGDMAARCANRHALTELVTARLSERTLDEWLARLRAEGVMAAPVNDYAEALADPQVKHRGLVYRVDHQTSGSVGVIGPAWVLSRTRTEMSPPPVLGQQSEEILKSWLGWTNEQIGRFRDGADQT